MITQCVGNCPVTRLEKWWVISGPFGMGPVRLRRWVEHFGGLEAAFEAWKWQRLNLGEDFDERLKRLHRTIDMPGVWAITWESVNYPDAWRECVDGPIVVFGKGAPLCASRKHHVAVVGTRNSCSRGAALGFEVGKKLAEWNRKVISGLAKGVDAAAHRGACHALGSTIACLGSGLEPVSPRENRGLANHILELGGTIITEHAIDCPVFPWHFAARNRLVVGLSEALVLIQSPAKGGALISLELALEAGIECLVYEPSNRSELGARWAGNRALLKEFPEMAWHHLEELKHRLGVEDESHESQGSPNVPEQERSVWNYLCQHGGATFQRLSDQFEVPQEQMLNRLFILEIKGLVKRIPGGWFVPIWSGYASG